MPLSTLCTIAKETRRKCSLNLPAAENNSCAILIRFRVSAASLPKARFMPGSIFAVPASAPKKFAAYCLKRPESLRFRAQLSDRLARISSASPSHRQWKICAKQSGGLKKFHRHGSEHLQTAEPAGNRDSSADATVSMS